jgi:hypothetical protein
MPAEFNPGLSAALSQRVIRAPAALRRLYEMAHLANWLQKQ